MIKYLIILFLIIPNIVFAKVYTSEEWASMYLRPCPKVDKGTVCIDKVKRNFKALSSHRRMILKALNKYKLPSWLGTIPIIESEFAHGAISPKGAIGLWQIMPRNLQYFLTKQRGPMAGYYYITKPTLDRAAKLGKDPKKSTEVACMLLSKLWYKYRNHKNRDKYVVWAYNAGEPRVDKYIRTGKGLKHETLNYYYQLLGLQQLLDDLLKDNVFGLK